MTSDPRTDGLDVLVIAAHPDDAEISVGGILARLVRLGRRVGVLDLTRGEMGTRGDRDARDAETAHANQVLGLAVRENLGLPDGRVEVSVENRELLAAALRRLAPDVVIAHHVDDLHPDHAAAGHLAREAWYLSGLRRLAELTGGPAARRPARLYHFFGHVAAAPTLVVDVGEDWATKLEAVRAYSTQLRPEGSGDTGAHFLFGADIEERMTTKARYWGEAISARYGEPLLHVGPIPVDCPLLRALGG